MPHTEKMEAFLDKLSVASFDLSDRTGIKQNLENMLKGYIPPSSGKQIGNWEKASGFSDRIPTLWRANNDNLRSIDVDKAVKRIQDGEVFMYESEAGVVFMSAKEYNGKLYLQCMLEDYLADVRISKEYLEIQKLHLSEPNLLDRIINAICEFFCIGKTTVCEEWDIAHMAGKIRNTTRNATEKIDKALEKEEDDEVDLRRETYYNEESRIKLRDEMLIENAKSIEKNIAGMPDYANMDGIGKKASDIKNGLIKKSKNGMAGTTMCFQDGGKYVYDQETDKTQFTLKFPEESMFIIGLCSLKGMNLDGFKKLMDPEMAIDYNIIVNVMEISDNKISIDDFYKGMDKAEEILKQLDPTSPEAFVLGEAYSNALKNVDGIHYGFNKVATENQNEYADERKPSPEIKFILDMQNKIRSGLNALKELTYDDFYNNYPEYVNGNLKTAVSGMLANEMLKKFSQMTPEKREEFLKEPKNIEAFSRLEKGLVDFVDKSKEVYKTKNAVMAGLGDRGGILYNFNVAQRGLHNEINNAGLKKEAAGVKNIIDEPGKEPMVPGIQHK